MLWGLLISFWAGLAVSIYAAGWKGAVIWVVASVVGMMLAIEFGDR